MGHQLLRLRGLAVALVVLALTAGAVLAGGNGPSAAADHGLGIAAEQSGHETLPARAGSDVESDEDAPEAEVQSEHADGDTHGSLVSEAAQMETPEGFDTHGAFVSCVARMNRGQLGPDADLSELVLTDLTTDDCERDAEDETDETAATDAAAASAGDGPGKSAAAKARQANRGPRGNSPSN